MPTRTQAVHTVYSTWNDCTINKFRREWSLKDWKSKLISVLIWIYFLCICVCVVQRGIVLGGKRQGGQLSRGQLSRGQLTRVGIDQGGNWPGENWPRTVHSVYLFYVIWTEMSEINCLSLSLSLSLSLYCHPPQLRPTTLGLWDSLNCLKSLPNL